MDIAEFTVDELAAQHGTRLPARHLMVGLTVSATISVELTGLPALPGAPPPPPLPGATVG